ncbi:hypothetical protein V5799_031393 [Amblyomma americanum]|uniref:Uncharacterized protein n=1 Tax=Amblyomma americanum TaxID=6943 RepID=A0AAQ4ELE5_AMBAM
MLIKVYTIIPALPTDAVLSTHRDESSNEELPDKSTATLWHCRAKTRPHLCVTIRCRVPESIELVCHKP